MASKKRTRARLHDKNSTSSAPSSDGSQSRNIQSRNELQQRNSSSKAPSGEDSQSRNNQSRNQLQQQNSTSRAPSGGGSQPPNVQDRNQLQQQTNMSNSESTRSANSQERNELESLSHAGSNEAMSTNKKHGRSHAKPWEGWGNGEKKILEWNERCQPISENAPKLSTQLGYFARQGNVFPLDKKSWDEMDPERLNDIWENVKENTNAPNGYKPICLESIATAWKRFKYNMKVQYYKSRETDEERLANPPPQVEPDQWINLVNRWGTSESQEISTRNAKNRENLCAYPRTGKKSFCRVEQEMRKQNLKVDKLGIFRYTRKKDDKFSEDDGAAEMEETIKRRLEALPPEKQDDEEERDKIFREVVGEDGHGRSLCMGVGIRPTTKRSKPTSDKDLELEVSLLREHIEEQEVRHQEKIDQVENKAKDIVTTILRRAGIPIPEDFDTFSQL